MSRDPRCLLCKYDDPTGLVRVWLCSNHQAELLERTLMEGHHLLGQIISDDVVQVEPNLHRYLTAAMREWPEILRKPDGGAQLIHSARALASLIDHMKWFLRHNERLAIYLVALHLQRLELEGDRYWDRDGLGPIDIAKGEDESISS